MTSYILMRIAQQKAEQGSPADAIDLATKARREFGAVSRRTQALSLVREAHGHALNGDAKASGRVISEAIRSAERAGPAEADSLDSHCTPLYVAAYDGLCQLTLGGSAGAAETLKNVVAAWPEGMRQDEVLFRAWLARAYADGGRAEEAQAQAFNALDLAFATGSMRALRVLTHIAGFDGTCRQVREHPR